MDLEAVLGAWRRLGNEGENRAPNRPFPPGCRSGGSLKFNAGRTIFPIVDKPYDLIPRGIPMPGFNRVDVSRATRGESLIRESPLLVLTARLYEMDRQVGIAAASRSTR